MNKKKNGIIQCLSTLFLPLGLYCFKRINKLRTGILLYISSYALTFLGGLIQASSLYSWGLPILYSSIGSFICYISSVLLPMYYMGKYTRQYNEALKV